MKVDFLSFERAEELIKIHGTPLLVLSKSRIKENYYKLKDCFPNVDLYYAVKANPNIEIIKLIDEIGGNFDISSIGEFELIKNMGIKSDKLLYTQPTKKAEEIIYLYNQGIDLFVFDNEHELFKLAKHAPHSNVLLRIAVSNPYCVIDLNYKFGADPQQAENLILKAIAFNLRPKGICFHVGSQSLNSYAYVETIMTCKKIFDLVALKGVRLELLDIGGGFPIKYIENIMPLDVFCEPINDTLNNYFHNTIIAEPGRVICGDAIVLITNIIGKSYRNNVKWYYIDDGIYNSFSGKVYDKANYKIVSIKTNKLSPCVLAGPTCDSFDIISKDIILPELETGDILIVPSMGAYTSSSASEFNKFEKTKIVAID